ncbi:UNVERIFIED_CONTAM: hypothetical protein Sangu_0693700 [Sesamum angustifolium]|uniref:Uncharacterized protein n=1 Tax=Sesamum angustifolium TaxID=2727405 RepID=A0AAW2PTQ0_9LAMI
MNYCVWDETEQAADILRQRFITVSLYEYTTPTLNPESPMSLARPYSTCTRLRLHSNSSMISETLMNSGERKTVPAYTSSQRMWICLSFMKVNRLVNVALSIVVPNGFVGFVMTRPFTLMLAFRAFSYASSRAFIVT